MTIGNIFRKKHWPVAALVTGLIVATAVGSRFWSDDVSDPTAHRPRVNATNVAVDGNASSDTAPVLLSATQRERLSRIERELDPTFTGWQTEAVNDAAQQQLTRLSAAMEHGTLTKSALDTIVTPEFRCNSLRPANLETLFDTPTTIVRRAIQRDGERKNAGSLEADIGQLPGSSSHDDYHVKLKIIHVDLQPTFTDTVVIAEGFGKNGSRPEQWSATWNCQWTNAKDALPRLRSVEVVDYEEVISRDGKGTWLRDDTEQVLGTAAGYHDQLAFGMDYWLRRLEGRLHVSRLGHNGIAIGDANGDGRDDIYVCQTGGLPNRLYVQQADGAAQDTSHAAGVDLLDDTTCALFVDLDNDGDQDLAVATISGGLIMSNDGQGRFTQRAYLPDCQNAFSLTAADYDQDRLLDLYVGRYWPTAENRGEIPIPVPYFDGQNGGQNVLLRNLGNLQFTDTTTAAGLDTDNTRYTMAAAWEDIDDDGDVDLYVANDFGKNCLYENQQGHFHNIAAEANVEDIASGMSVSFADMDNDKKWDIYVSNMFSSAGNRIAYQRQYEERFEAAGTASLRRMARGNSLFRNLGGRSFSDISVPSRTTMARWAWGSIFADINNDGWDDLLAVNGNITAEKPGDL